jgi:hypothetical protein
MGWTNVVTIFHENVTFLLELEIPHVAWPFVNDCSIKGLASHYKNDEGGYKTLGDNSSIHKFVWQHLLDVHCILHCLHCASATISAKKLFMLCLSLSPSIAMLTTPFFFLHFLSTL